MYWRIIFMENNMQNRLRSKVVWLSAISLILLILNTFGVFDKIGTDETSVKVVIDSFLSILVLFGILNDPRDPKNF
jgi:uncharacterized membrane protein